MDDVRAGWELGNARIEPISVSHTPLRKFLCMAQSPPIVLLALIVFIRGLTAASPADPRHCWPAWAGYWGVGEDMPSSCLLLYAAMIQAERHFNRPLSALWRTPTSLWAPWLSDTECLRSPTPLGIYSHPVQSFSVTPACPFLCLSAWEDERQPKLKSAAAEAQKMWISFGKMGAFDFISNWNSHLTYFLIRGSVR